MTHTPQLLRDLFEAIEATDLDESPELRHAWGMLTDEDKRWVSEVQAENERLREFVRERTEIRR